MVYCSWRRRGENKPWLRAGRGVVGIAVLQLGYRTEQHQRCILPQIMRLDCRWDLQLCICLPGYMIFNVNSSLLICRRQCIAWLCCLLIFHRKRKIHAHTTPQTSKNRHHNRAQKQLGTKDWRFLVCLQLVRFKVSLMCSILQDNYFVKKETKQKRKFDTVTPFNRITWSKNTTFLCLKTLLVSCFSAYSGRMN